jgi:hypothetical protein
VKWIKKYLVDIGPCKHLLYCLFKNIYIGNEFVLSLPIIKNNYKEYILEIHFNMNSLTHLIFHVIRQGPTNIVF